MIVYIICIGYMNIIHMLIISILSTEYSICHVLSTTIIIIYEDHCYSAIIVFSAQEYIRILSLGRAIIV